MICVGDDVCILIGGGGSQWSFLLLWAVPVIDTVFSSSGYVNVCIFAYGLLGRVCPAVGELSGEGRPFPLPDLKEQIVVNQSFCLMKMHCRRV